MAISKGNGHNWRKKNTHLVDIRIMCYCLWVQFLESWLGVQTELIGQTVKLSDAWTIHVFYCFQPPTDLFRSLGNMYVFLFIHPVTWNWTVSTSLSTYLSLCGNKRLYLIFYFFQLVLLLSHKGWDSLMQEIKLFWQLSMESLYKSSVSIFYGIFTFWKSVKTRRDC